MAPCRKPSTTRKRAILARCHHTAANASHLQSGNPRRGLLRLAKGGSVWKMLRRITESPLSRAPTQERQARFTLAKTWD
jgi:hypothetical protein